jgi:hypothetical protein
MMDLDDIQEGNVSNAEDVINHGKDKTMGFNPLAYTAGCETV